MTRPNREGFSPAVLLAVWAALVALAALSLWVYEAVPGGGGTGVALGIASAKAALVALVFMELGRSGRALRGLFLLLVAVVAAVFGLTLLDVAFR